ncbi:hypothetical protein ACFL5U_03165 [Candidatus Margulisiibacteriota bacterium]
MLPAQAQQKEIEILSNVPAYKRLENAFELFDFARERVAAEIRRLNPQMPETELKNLVKKRFLDQ